MDGSDNHLAVSVPCGERATVEEMRTYGETLQAFICLQESLLPKVDDSVRHNEIVDYLNILANGYNEQLRLFKAAERCREQSLFIALVCAAS